MARSSYVRTKRALLRADVSPRSSASPASVLILALMADDGIHAESPEITAAASRRFAALVTQSFRAHPALAPPRPPVRLRPPPPRRLITGNRSPTYAKGLP
jgi:hypothetical protein